MSLKYFTLDEFRCKHCGGLPENGIHPVLLKKLDELRAKLGCPIYISSGYRCPEHNAAVGGVENSQHVKGTGADVYCEDESVYRLYQLAREIGFDGISYYPIENFVHLDVRDGGESPNGYCW